MIVKLLSEHHLEFLSLKGGCRGLSGSTLVKMSNCWKSHALAQFVLIHIRNKGEVVTLIHPAKRNTDHSKAVLLLWIFFCYLCLVSVMLSCVLFTAFWSAAGKGLTSQRSYL